MLPEEHRKRMEHLLNRYIRTVKADLKHGRGMEMRKGRTIVLRRKNEHIGPLLLRSDIFSRFQSVEADSLFQP
jgi:hypothetical protein